MLKNILLQTGIALSANMLFSQCPPASEPTSNSETEVTYDPDEYEYPAGSDYSDDYSETRGVSAPIHIGYGQRYNLTASSRTLENSAGLPVDKSWLSDRPVNVFDFWFRVGQRKKTALGMTLSFQHLGGFESQTAFEPQGGIVSDSQFVLKMDFEKKARVIGSSFFTEYSLIGEEDDVFRVTARADVGYTVYSASSEVSYYDSCGCLFTPVYERAGSTVFTTRLGLGAELDLGPVGIKGYLGYEMQAANTFITKGQFDSRYGYFDKREYNYSGDPDESLFSIPGYTEDKIRSRNGFLYVGFSVFVNLQRQSDQ